MHVIAHLSDLHLDDERSAARTRAVMAHLEGLAVDLDAVLVTGDIADHGRPSEYALAQGLLTSRHPVLVLPGNHDGRAAFRAGLLSGPATPEPVNRIHRMPGLTLALCDSSVPGRDDGLLADETLAWLDEELGQDPPGVPALVAFHHPPVLLHSPYIDALRQFGEERLAALVDRHPRIAGFLCGHAHTAAAAEFAGRPLRVAPGVVSTLRLPWEPPADPAGSSGPVHLDLPPALAFHVLDEAGGLTTHYRSVLG